VEGRIIRTCEFLAGAAALAGLVAAPVAAVRSDDASAFTRYIRARAADAAGDPELAAGQYAAALEEAPGNLPLLTRTYRQATIAGDRALALRSARLLDQAGALPPDGRLLLVVDHVSRRDWTGARAEVTRVEREQVFAFLAPILRAWITAGAGDADPLVELNKLGSSALSSAYGSEHRALILLAQGKRAEASTIVRAKVTGGDIRDVRQKLLIAQSFAAAGDRTAAIAMLPPDNPASTVMRARIESGKRLPEPKVDPSFGLSQLMLAVAVDLNRERVSPLSVAIARLAQFAEPDNSEAMLGVAQILAASGRDDAALAALSPIPPDDLFAEAARNARIRLLVSRGDKEAALAEAKAATTQPGADGADWTLLGDIMSSLNRPAEAADAYGKAIALIGPDVKNDRVWTLWLLRGSALEQADAWPEAKAALTRALALAPDEAVVLNHLGYSQLERRENVVEAKALIERASKLMPDDPAITDSLGWAHYLQGDVKAAIPKLEMAAEGDPGGAEINEHLGDAYWSAGRRIEARFAWQAAKVTADETDSKRLASKINNGLDAGDAAP
jgi:Flp pilus assembly protein TadD